MEPHNRQQIDHKRWYECILATLCFLMKSDGMVRGRMESD